MWVSFLSHLLIISNNNSGKCATGNWELFALLGEAQGAGVVLGWCFIWSKALKDPQNGNKQKILVDFLQHFRDEWGVRPLVTLSDKDFSEINAYSKVFPSAKHQLCFWHCLHAVKKQLAVTHWQPGFYNIAQAWKEFPFIHEHFLPLAQRRILPENEVFWTEHLWFNSTTHINLIH